MEIKFTYAGVLVLDYPANHLEPDDEDDDDDNSNKHCFSSTNATPSRSSYYSSSPDSSNCTPKSITADLTNVPDLVIVERKLLLEKEKHNGKTDSPLRNSFSVPNDISKNGELLPSSSSSAKNKTSSTAINGTFAKNDASSLVAKAKVPHVNGTAKPAKDDGSLILTKKKTPQLNGSIVGENSTPSLAANEKTPPANTLLKTSLSKTSSPLVNGNPATKNGILKSVSPVRNGLNCTLSTNGILKKNAEASMIKRKRLLSDRGERELEYPICDARTSTNGWVGCTFLKGKSGAGLCNSSNDCFLNSVLQSIVHTAQLARFLVESHDENKCNFPNRMHCFHCSMRKHVLRATSSTKPFEAFWIRQFLCKIFPSHRHGYQEDAHEMLTLLLSALEPPMPKRSSLNGLNNKMLPSAPPPSTPIEQIFGGNLRNQIRCDTCGTIHTNYEKIREINLGLTRHANAKVIELIQDFFGQEQLQCFMCKNCKCKRSAIRHTTILRSPSVLIVQLKRFNLFGGKNRLPVRPDLTLQLGRFSFNKEPITYQLHGIIEHIGGGVNFGHYVSAWRGFDERNWFHFDDSEVTPMSEVKVTSMEPYILFYTRIFNANGIDSPSSFQPKKAEFYPQGKRPCFTPFSFNLSSSESQNRPSSSEKGFQRQAIIGPVLPPNLARSSVNGTPSSSSSSPTVNSPKINEFSKVNGTILNGTSSQRFGSSGYNFPIAR